MGILRYQIIDDESEIDDQYFRNSSRAYLVEATPDLDSNQVRTGLPFAIGQFHPDDAGQRVKKISLKLADPNLANYFNVQLSTDPGNNEPCLLWRATISFGPWDPNQHSEDGDPINMSPVVRFSGVTNQEIMDIDKDGNPVINAAGSYFDPPVMRDRTRPIIKIIRNEADFSDSTVLAFADKVNSDTFYNYPPRTLKLSAPEGEPMYSQLTGLNYFKVTYEAHYNEDTWDFNVLNQGYEALVTPGSVGSTTTTRKIILVGGQPATQPVLLTATGQPLLPPVNASDIVLLNFKGYGEINFTSTFGFPTGLLN